MKDISKETIYKIKKQLDYITNNGENISIYCEPKIEEIYSTFDKTVAKAVVDIRVEYNDRKYIKNNNDIFGNWQDYEEYMLKENR